MKKRIKVSFVLLDDPITNENMGEELHYEVIEISGHPHLRAGEQFIASDGLRIAQMILAQREKERLG